MPYHLKCGPKCGCGCGAPLTLNKGYTDLPNGSKFNSGCLKCEDCEKVILANDYFIYDNTIMCRICKIKS